MSYYKAVSLKVALRVSLCLMDTCSQIIYLDIIFELLIFLLHKLFKPDTTDESTGKRIIDFTDKQSHA